MRHYALRVGVFEGYRRSLLHAQQASPDSDADLAIASNVKPLALNVRKVANQTSSNPTNCRTSLRNLLAIPQPQTLGPKSSGPETQTES